MKGEGLYRCTFFDLGNRWRRMVSVRLRPLYLLGTSVRYSLARSLFRTIWRNENS
jgi:hypothetical protein